MDVFNINLKEARRILLWGPVTAAKTGMLGLGIKRVKRQNLRSLAFIPKILAPEIGLQHSRDGITFEAVPFENLQQAQELVTQQAPQVVFIEEVQFIEELPQFLDFLTKRKITAIMTGLTSRDDGQPWPVVRDILHTCNVVQMPGVCHVCDSTNALYSKNVSGQSSGTDHILLDTTKQPDHDTFRAICYACFFL
jgi:thymidine kinase